MKSPKKQHQIAQILSNTDTAECDVVLYTCKDEYKIAIPSKYGMFPQTLIANILNLSQIHEFNFYISETCYAFQEENVYIIIY